MNRYDLLQLSLLSLLAFGCADAVSRATRPDSAPSDPLPIPPLRPRKHHMSFQVEADSPLRPTAEDAARQWSLALGLSVTVTADGDIPIFLTDELSCPAPANLPKGMRVGACSPDIGTESARIEVPTSTPERYWLTNLLHEMGHHLRGLRPAPEDSEYDWLAGDHHDDPSGLMYGGKVADTARITPRDVTFVCEYELACPSSPQGMP